MSRSRVVNQHRVDPNIKVEPEVEHVCTPSPLVPHAPLADIASFGYCRWLRRLGHQFWRSLCRGLRSLRRWHVRGSEGLAPSSRRVARPSSLSSVMHHGLHTTDAERNHNIRIPGFSSDMMPIADSQAVAAPATQRARSTKLRERRSCFVRIASRRWHRPSEKLSWCRISSPNRPLTHQIGIFKATNPTFTSEILLQSRGRRTRNILVSRVTAFEVKVAFFCI